MYIFRVNHFYLIKSNLGADVNEMIQMIFLISVLNIISLR